MNTVMYGKYKPLSQEEVLESKNKYGENKLKEKKAKGFFSQFLSNFNDPIIRILLIALGLNLALLYSHKNWYETVGIIAAVLVSTLVSTISEYGSETAFIKLQKESLKSICTVERQNGSYEIPITELVVGDIVHVSAGEKIYADGTIISGEISVDQSALNGESNEVHKSPLEKDNSKGLSSPVKLYKGSLVTDGEAIMRVDYVGEKTFYGSLADEIQDGAGESPLKMKLSALAKSISTIGYICAMLVVAADLFLSFSQGFEAVTAREIGASLIHAITLGISVVVMAVPEGLPMMITVVLSRNMLKMQKDKVMVRKLVGIETAGGMSILFADKTGTLTKGKMRTSLIADGSGKTYRKPADIPLPIRSETELCSVFCSGCKLSGMRAVGGNSTDRAFLDFFLPIKSTSIVKKAMLESKINFSSVYKYSSAQISLNGSKHYTLIKGAPEVILPYCTQYLDANGNRTAIDINSVYESQKTMAKKAMRVLAIAISDAPIDRDKSFHNLCFVALIGLRDEIRREAAPSVEKLNKAGIKVIMMTGDNKDTAMAIAEECGILKNSDKENAVLTSDELSKLSDQQLGDILPQISVISRAIPTDKSRLVRIAENLGYVCGMTGDGINDAPALKKANIGFAMGNGTEIAKDASDIVIEDSNISSICKAVLYGRAIFENIRKFIVFQLTINLSACALSVIGPLIGVESPISVMQMLWINIIMDTLAGLAFAGEYPSPELLKATPKSKGEKILTKEMGTKILLSGAYMTAICLCYFKLPFFYEYFGGDYNESAYMTGFFALFVFSGVFNCFNARVNGMNLLRNLRKNPTFIFIIILIFAIQLLMIYSGSPIFACVPLSANELKMILLVSASVIPFDLLRKLICKLFFRR